MYVANAPGGIFALFKRKAPWGTPTTREGVRKGPAAEEKRDAAQHAVGGIARVSLFFLIFIHQFKPFFFLLCVSTSELNTTRPTICFFLEAPREAPYALFLF